jgi:hypothetical protein
MPIGTLVGPATIYVGLLLIIPLAFLLRYSLNAFVPGKFMVEALTIENYVKFFTDPYYRSAPRAHDAGRGALHADLPRRGRPARLRARPHALALEEPADHPGDPAAIRRQRGPGGGVDGGASGPRAS